MMFTVDVERLICNKWNWRVLQLSNEQVNRVEEEIKLG